MAERMVDPERSLAPEFILSLVPIALVYAISHYFTFLLIQGQYVWPLASDPFGFGWNLFGTLDHVVNQAPLSPDSVKWVQWASLVAGHVAGLAVAHDRAVSIFPEREHSGPSTPCWC